MFATAFILAPVLAQPERDYTRIFIWSLALLGVLAVGLVVVSKVKRRLQEPDQPVTLGFTLSDLRQLHKIGQMTDEEFERAKAKVVEAAKKAAERDAKPAPAARPVRRQPGATKPGLEDAGEAGDVDPPPQDRT